MALETQEHEHTTPGQVPIITRLRYSPVSAVKLNVTQQAARDGLIEKMRSGRYRTVPTTCVCGQSGGELVALKDRYGLPLRTVLCQKCGVLRSDPYFDDESLSSFYTDDYLSLFRKKHVHLPDYFDEQRKKGEDIFKILSQRGAISEGRKVLEVGCGSGGILSVFAERGYEVAGCDFAPEYIDYGRSQGLNLYEGGVTSLPPKERADLIILNHVLEHFQDPIAELRAIVDRLSPNGYVYIALPGVLSIPQTYRDVELFLQCSHKYHFSAATLDFLASLGGLSREWGTEEIKAIYRPSSGPQMSPDRSDADAVRSALLSAERQRAFRRFQLLVEKAWYRLWHIRES